MKRILLVLTVALVMAAMLTLTPSSAFAKVFVQCAEHPTGNPDFGQGSHFRASFHPCGPNGHPG